MSTSPGSWNSVLRNILQQYPLISKYSNSPHPLLRAGPASRRVDSAVYLFRHGIIHVNGHDYHYAIAPFLQKLERLQQNMKDGVGTGHLAFLNSYSSWISENSIGKVSMAGLHQSRELGRAFRMRYGDWLDSKESFPESWMKIWTDAAERCEQTARAFGEGLGGKQRATTSDHELSS